MKISIETKPKKRRVADLLVVPFWKGKKKPEIALKEKGWEKEISAPIDAGDFEGNSGETALVYLRGAPEKKAILLGLGDESAVTAETVRRAYGGLCKWAHRQKAAKSWNVFFPDKSNKGNDELLRGVLEGILTPNSASECQRSKERPSLVEAIHLYYAPTSAKTAVDKALHLFEGVYFARELINDNADSVTPEFLAKKAKELAKRFSSLKATVLNRQQIEKEKLGLIAAVGRAGMNESRLIILEYRGNPRSKECTALVGKGVTYDTGGLNLKPTGFMETMKSDMSGGAAVLGTMLALSALKYKGNVVAVVPSVENAIDANSYKPGDVYKSYAGLLVEIGNTDAEGRLILADALAYAKAKFHPTRIVDIATLTGAAVIALGKDSIPYFTNDDTLAKAFEEAGQTTFERVWRMPLFDEYRELLKSDLADLKNIGSGRQAGTVVAAKFLQEFIGNTPWVHLDIAGKGYLEENKRYLPKYATGVGVRLMIEALENLK